MLRKGCPPITRGGCSSPGGGGQGQADHPSYLLTHSLFCGLFSRAVDSPVGWTLPASATESGFLPGAGPAPLLSALTTEPVGCVPGEPQACSITCVEHTFPVALFAFAAFPAVTGIPGQSLHTRASAFEHLPLRSPQHRTAGSFTVARAWIPPCH